MTNATEQSSRVRFWAGAYSITVLIVFLVLVLLGLVMRIGQSGIAAVPPDLFYAIMTLHGLGMAGLLYTAGYAAIWYLSSKYVRPSVGLMGFNLALILLGVVGLIVATLIGRFGPGWYMLYPLPFMPTWPTWSIGLAVVSVMLLGVAWLLGQLDLLRAIAGRFGLSGMLGWQYLRKGETEDELPPVVLIVAISMIAGAVTTIVGAVMLMLYIAQWLAPELQFDALLMKNAVFLFGHTLVNITMYCGVAVVYELLPTYSGRPWKTNPIVVISWNFVLLLVLLAFLHHLYMDFVQPVALQVAGQIASFLSAVPATVVTVFGVMTQVYRSGIRWTFVPLSMVLGVMGWIVGGLAAIVDSTIVVNILFHNTLWVPAHFHTYFLVGFVFMLFGFIYHFLGSQAEHTAKFSLGTMILGGYGFLLMFYLAGLESVPRRFADYTATGIDSVTRFGEMTAMVAVAFITVFLIGMLIYYSAVFRSLGAWYSKVSTEN
ncbi:MAG TPA: cbb3-type cytochrome c oxidase subunit I [Arenicellales bacterium]|jgi:cytochrome c oxidase subunit 1|nr:cbb3-type cytochrome c oxidase subunit I [Arenicellales bacterium]HJP50360.1 cbb3-type cytochrome c oxidase subunit I [Pseudomonadales bacterium]